MKKDQGGDKNSRVGFPEKKEFQTWTAKRGGTRQIGSLMPGLTREAFKKKSPILVRLGMDWEDIVGLRLSRVTEPRRLSAGTLTLACSGPIAMELQHLTPQILERINTTCGLRGDHVIQRLKIVQDMAAFERVKPPSSRAFSVEVSDIEDDELRDALGRLGGRIKTRSSRR